MEGLENGNGKGNGHSDRLRVPMGILGDHWGETGISGLGDAIGGQVSDPIRLRERTFTRYRLRRWFKTKDPKDCPTNSSLRWNTWNGETFAVPRCYTDWVQRKMQNLQISRSKYRKCQMMHSQCNIDTVGVDIMIPSLVILYLFYCPYTHSVHEYRNGDRLHPPHRERHHHPRGRGRNRPRRHEHDTHHHRRKYRDDSNHSNHSTHSTHSTSHKSRRSVRDKASQSTLLTPLDNTSNGQYHTFSVTPGPSPSRGHPGNVGNISDSSSNDGHGFCSFFPVFHHFVIWRLHLWEQQHFFNLIGIRQEHRFWWESGDIEIWSLATMFLSTVDTILFPLVNEWTWWRSLSFEVRA